MLIIRSLLFLLCITSAPLMAEMSTDQAIEAATHRLERSPNQRSALIALGSAYARKGRETNDPQYFDLAHTTLQRSVTLYPEDNVGRRHYAYVLSLRHDFHGALREATEAARRNPRDADAYALVGDANIELGDYAAAEAAYGSMITLQESLSTLSRRSGLHSLKGNPQAAITDLRHAIVLGEATGEPAESIAWAQWQLGMEHLNVGEYAQAQLAFQQSLHRFPDYFRAHAGLGMVAAARGKPRQALKHYERAMAIVPMPEYAIALAELHGVLGQRAQALTQHALAKQMLILNSDPYNRELIAYRLEHGDRAMSAQALELAERSLQTRQDIYAYDILAWALYHNGRLPEARIAMERAMQLGTRDAKLFYRAGVIHHALGNTALARTYLKRALSTHPRFHPLHARHARQLLRQLAV